MTKRIFKTILYVTLPVLLLCIGLITAIQYGYFEAGLRKELKNGALYIAQGIEMDGIEYLSALPRNENRMTWVDADGQVLFDSQANVAALENHADREEIAEALTSGEGSSYRYSKTLSEKTLYYALRLEDGTVLRVSGAQSSILALLWQMLQPILLIVLAAALLAGVLASKLAKRIVWPINALDLDDPASCEVYDELAPLIRKLQNQKLEIAERMEALCRNREDLSAIAESMNEGLIFLGPDETILSLNSSAARLFQADREKNKGQKLITLNRSSELSRVAAQALGGESATAVLELHGRSYALYASPVPGRRGAVLLVLDITEKQQAELLRREFSANVSHELKTPLTSISGYAEIIRDGLADPQDVPEFAGRIHGEANRLLALIRDIIKLSSLDEGALDGQKESVELLALCGTVCGRMQQTATEKGLSLTLEGNPVLVYGVRAILDEMIFNLCDNAIQYNKPGGSVAVAVRKDAGTALLTVTDTGIGIPQECREKVFERFYRVDKSHSKQTGGTGLGLSIVKHAAAYHGARISLRDVPEGGTRVEVRFPLA
ncbi:MAG: ATP-binding protein [Candidatus Pelethousia sp.]|nr:ATP-binding protein [Candidatus Pelethousia sp.]